MGSAQNNANPKRPISRDRAFKIAIVTTSSVDICYKTLFCEENAAQQRRRQAAATSRLLKLKPAILHPVSNIRKMFVALTLFRSSALNLPDGVMHAPCAGCCCWHSVSSGKRSSSCRHHSSLHLASLREIRSVLIYPSGCERYSGLTVKGRRVNTHRQEQKGGRSTKFQRSTKEV
eukprot:scaffold15929_cov159-Ochromonas_danica.AAC.3